MKLYARCTFIYSTESHTKDTERVIQEAHDAFQTFADKLGAAGICHFRVEAEFGPATAAASAAPIDQPNEGGA